MSVDSPAQLVMEGDSSWVNADIQFDSNAAGLSATRNNVGGSIQVFSNEEGVTISGNTID